MANSHQNAGQNDHESNSNVCSRFFTISDSISIKYNNLSEFYKNQNINKYDEPNKKAIANRTI
jgi:hypothetical protein